MTAHVVDDRTGVALPGAPTDLLAWYCDRDGRAQAWCRSGERTRYYEPPWYYCDPLHSDELIAHAKRGGVEIDVRIVRIANGATPRSYLDANSAPMRPRT